MSHARSWNGAFSTGCAIPLWQPATMLKRCNLPMGPGCMAVWEGIVCFVSQLGMQKCLWKAHSFFLSNVAHSCFCSKPSIYPTHTGMEDNRAKTKKERRQALKEQWLNYLLTVAEEKICVSCWATQLKEWLPESHVGYWQGFCFLPEVNPHR